MAHYYCQGECKGFSYEIKNCDNEDCSMKGQTLTECSCDKPESHQHTHPAAEAN